MQYHIIFGEGSFLLQTAFKEVLHGKHFFHELKLPAILEGVSTQKYKKEHPWLVDYSPFWGEIKNKCDFDSANSFP